MFQHQVLSKASKHKLIHLKRYCLWLQVNNKEAGTLLFPLNWILIKDWINSNEGKTPLHPNIALNLFLSRSGVWVWIGDMVEPWYVDVISIWMTEAVPNWIPGLRTASLFYSLSPIILKSKKKSGSKVTVLQLKTTVGRPTSPILCLLDPVHQVSWGSTLPPRPRQVSYKEGRVITSHNVTLGPHPLKCGLSFPSSEIILDMSGFSVFLHASLIDFNTAITTVWPQSKIVQHNDPSIFLRFRGCS